MYSMGGYTECYSCPVGWLCSNGLAVPCGYGTTMTSVTTVVQEDEGSTSSVSGIYGGACIECPAGNACPGGGVVEECSAGTFSAGGSATTVCRPCEPGTFASTNGTEACELCAPGYTSNFGSSECRECPSGAYSNGGEHPCSPCPAGTYSEGASAECISCPLGYYASTTSMSLCEQCPESTNTTAEGSTSVDDCV
ncbi:unnamed protein product [Sphacelaria rigidula]